MLTRDSTAPPLAWCRLAPRPRTGHGPPAEGRSRYPDAGQPPSRRRPAQAPTACQAPETASLRPFCSAASLPGPASQPQPCWAPGRWGPSWLSAREWALATARSAHLASERQSTPRRASSRAGALGLRLLVSPRPQSPSLRPSAHLPPPMRAPCPRGRRCRRGPLNPRTPAATPHRGSGSAQCPEPLASAPTSCCSGSAASPSGPAPYSRPKPAVSSATSPSTTPEPSPLVRRRSAAWPRLQTSPPTTPPAPNHPWPCPRARGLWLRARPRPSPPPYRHALR
mmetsp:Transcript_5966/g.12101  ORF Transcript_5966/g.12101 Transcript_5966/m.12101 type:complete len:282 (+) Transcript_5966:64-909(+)